MMMHIVSLKALSSQTELRPSSWSYISVSLSTHQLSYRQWPVRSFSSCPWMSLKPPPGPPCVFPFLHVGASVFFFFLPSSVLFMFVCLEPGGVKESHLAHLLPSLTWSCACNQATCSAAGLNTAVMTHWKFGNLDLWRRKNLLKCKVGPDFFALNPSSPTWCDSYGGGHCDW